ncbi:hypothetical protein [Candidatus Contubernalis alkaliaceticus]|uniref:hypothetical protein n=1 Tax=Candidatus Contubernalis alkaliaceticus TaxID=338645 RepID=UPI001F4BF92C|nr:hypothetical protein [Candidatus Contubernalis alkalaceticus]UNC92712.1 hypothetical protein HUE98_11765 [Candidatus Contubernalis alkalaceticus]
MEEIRIPIGLCKLIYGTQTLNNLADRAVFQAIPKYKQLFGGKGNTTQKYLLEKYDVSMIVSLTEENYDTLKLSIPYLETYEQGFYDNPNNPNMEGKPLIIHPSEAGETKEYDIVILDAILNPEKPFVRTYDKRVDKINVHFLGRPVMRNDKLSYFFIGDWDSSGVLDIDD